MLQRNIPISTPKFDKGLFTFSNFLQNEKGHSPNCMNIKWNFDDSIQKRLGSNSQNTVALGGVASTSWTIDTDADLSTLLKAYWKLDETSGTRFDTFSSHNLTQLNNTLYQTGIRGNAAMFVAANSNSLFIKNTATLTVSGSTPFSISTWFYLNSTSSDIERTIISKMDAVVGSDTLLLLHGSGAQGSTTIIDSSIYSNAVAATGGANIDSAQSVFLNTSILFKGSGYLSFTDASNRFNFGSNNFMIDFRYRPDNRSGRQVIIAQYDNDDNFWMIEKQSDHTIRMIFVVSDVLIAEYATTTFTVSNDIWYHIVCARNGINGIICADGSVKTTTEVAAFGNSSTGDFNSDVYLGGVGFAFSLSGWIDEARVLKGKTMITGAYPVPTVQYGATNQEYWLCIETDNVVALKVSSDGLSFHTSIRAASNGAVALNTWYNVVAWYQSGAAAHLGISVNQSVNTANYTGGIKTGSAAFVIGANSSSITSDASFFMDGRIDEVGFWKQALSANERSDMYGGGSGNTFTSSEGRFTWAVYDFGASATRWVTVAAGTGIYASSNLCVTFVSVATSRTQNYQFFERSKNVLVACSDSYDQTLYWAGSAGTFFLALAVNSAPKAKFAQNHQGFLILMNSKDSNNTLSKRRFHYVDESLQLTSTWADYFDLPSTADDEITGSFILNRTLYVSTKYRIYRVSYVGGNPDWSYQVVAYWGYVPRTIQRASIEGGEVAIGLDWSRRIRIFDGTKDTIISDNIEDDNRICEFSTKKISFSGSGLIVSNSVIDQIEQEYRLNVSIGANSTQTTHAIVLNLRSLAMYPYSNQGYQCMAMAESAGRQYLLAGDRSGRIHILNTGNLDVATPIDEVYESPFIFSRVPGIVQKANKMDMYFKKDSCGTLFYQDRADFSSLWSDKYKQINIVETDSNLHIIHSVDIPSTHNIYQYKLASSSSTAEPWHLTHTDYFFQSMGIGKGQ